MRDTIDRKASEIKKKLPHQVVYDRNIMKSDEKHLVKQSI